jgi:hypothetical protein
MARIAPSLASPTGTTHHGRKRCPWTARPAAAAACLLSIALTACGPQIVYDYRAPTTPEGRLCAAQCGNLKTYCDQAEQNRYQQCQMSYNLMLQNYQACREAKGKHCAFPSVCAGPSTYRCAEDYRACFTSCGGDITAKPVAPSR